MHINKTRHQTQNRVKTYFKTKSYIYFVDAQDFLLRVRARVSAKVLVCGLCIPRRITAIAIESRHIHTHIIGLWPHGNKNRTRQRKGSSRQNKTDFQLRALPVQLPQVQRAKNRRTIH